MELAPFDDAAVEAAFKAFPAGVKDGLMRLRQAILDTAAETAGVGPLIETLKWREPAYLPRAPRIGTTIRINGVKGSPDRYAMYVHCQTSLVETYRAHYPDVFAFEGQRAMLFRTGQDIPLQPLKHCIALALTYHRWAKA